MEESTKNDSCPIGDAFDKCESDAQWAFVLALKIPRESIQVDLDNDNTSISFGETDEDGDDDLRFFKDYAGDGLGTQYLLRALGFVCEYV